MELLKKTFGKRFGSRLFPILILLLAAMLTSSLLADDQASGEDNKTLRYYKVLLRRPESGYVFDKFCNRFLDTSTMQQLEEFFKENAEKTGKGARLLLGYYYIKNSDYDAAKKEFTALADSPDVSEDIRISAFQHRGNANLSLLDFDAAIADYNSALKLNPPEKLKLQIAKKLSKSYIRSGKQKKAIALWEKIAAENPNKQQLQEDLVELYIEEELYTEGLRVSDALLAKTTDKYDRVMRTLRKGDIYQFSGKDPNAIELYSETLASVGQGTWLEREILAQISRVFLREENKKELEKHFAELIEQYPARTTLVMKYSQILAGNGKYDEAIEVFRKVLVLSPGDKDVAWQYVQLLNDAKKQDEAIKAMESLVAQYKGDLELRLSLAELYNSAEKTDLAVKTVKSYLADSDKTEYAYTRAGRLFEKFKSRDDADQVYLEMAKAFGDSVGAQEVLAAYYNRTDRKDKAVEIWKKLADSEELEVVLRACITLKNNKHSEDAFAIIESKFDEFKHDIVFLSNAVDIASGLKNHDQAVSWAMEMISKAQTSGQLEKAVVKAKSVVKYANKLDNIIKSLQDNQNLSTQQSCLLAEFYNEIGEYEKAIKTLDAADGQNEGLVLSQRIRLCSQNYNWFAAAEAGEKLFASKGGSNSRNAKKLVTLYRKCMQADKAINWVNRWKELAPGSTTPWMVHADILHDNGKFTESIDTLRIAVRKFDANEQLLNKLGQYYRDAGKYADAKRLYWKMYEKSESIRDKLTYVEHLASISKETGTFESLTKQFKERKQQDRLSVLPRLALARIYDRSEDYELRRRELIEVSRLKPDDIGVIYEIAKMEEMAGRWQDAVATLKKAKQLDTTSKTDYNIARLHMDYGNEEQGIKMILDLAGGYDAQPRDAEKLADMLIMQGYPEMAVKYLDKIVSQHPEDWRLKYIRAIALEEEDHLQEAAEAFVALLEEDQELNLKKNSSTSAHFGMPGNYLTELKKVIPARAVDFMMKFNYSYQAYMHRQNRNHYRPSGGSLRSTLIQLPSDLDLLKSYSIIHILGIKTYLDEDVSAGIIDKMKQSGLPDAELYAELTLNNYHVDYERTITRLLEKYPDHEIPLALSSWVSRQVTDPNIFRKQIDKFSESYPLLAAIAGLRLYSLSEKKDEKLLDESFKMLEAVQKPTVMSIQLVMQYYHMHMGNMSENDKPILKRLSAVLINWNDRYVPSQNQSMRHMNNEVFRMVCALVVQSGDYELLADLVNKELKKFKKNVSNNQGQYSQSVSSNQGDLLTPPTFPPMELPGYPNQLIQFFAATNNNYYMRQANYDPVEFSKHADKIKDDLIKLYIYQTADKKEEEKKLYDKMLIEEKKSPALETYIAARAFSKEQYPVAISIVNTARQKASSYKEKQQFDKLLVNAAINFMGLSKERQEKLCNEEEKAKIVELGQKAVLRLRKGKLQGNQRSELSEAMRRLGLKKEADKIDKQIAAAAAHGSSSTSYGGVSRAISTNRNFDKAKIEKLIGSGEKDAALKLIQRFLEGHAKNDLASTHSNSSYYTRDALRFISEKKLNKEVAETCKPEGSGTSRSWQVYAKVCEYLDMKEEIKKAWGKILEIRPKDAEANLYAAMYTLEDDPNKAENHVSKIRKNLIPMMVEKIASLANNTHDDYERRLTAAKLGIALLKHPDIDERTDLSYMQRLLSEMENSIYIRNPNNSHHINGVFSSPRKNDPVIQKIAEERDSLYEELVNSLYEKPTSCDIGFINLMKFKRARNKFDPNEAAEMAMEALERYRYVPAHMSYSSYTNEQETSSVCGILLEKALKDGNLEQKTEEMAEILSKNRNPKIARQLKSLSSLYTMDAEDFPAAALNYCKLHNQANLKLISEHNPFKQTLLAALERSDIDLTDYVCSYIKKNNYNLQYNDLAIAAKSIQKSGGYEKVEEYVDRIATILTAPADKRKAYCEKHYNPNQGYSHGTPNYMVYTYYNFLRELVNGGDLEFIGIVFDHIKYVPVLHMERLSNIQYTITSVLRSSNHQKSADLIVKMGLTGEPNEIVFTPAVNQDQGNCTINSYIVNYLKNNSSYKKNFNEALDKCPDSFGKDFIKAVSKNDLNRTAGVILENFEKIKKLSEEKQADLVTFVRETTGSVKGFGDKAEFANLNKWYTTIAKAATNEIFENFMNMPSSKIIDNNMYDHRFHEMVSKIGTTVIHDPNKFEKLMVRAEKLYKKGVRIRRFQKLQGSYKDAFVENFMNHNRNSPLVCKFYIDTVRKKGSSIRRLEDHRIRRIFDDYLRDKRNTFKPGENKKAFAELVGFAGRIYGKGNASIGLSSSMNSYIFNDYRKPGQFKALLKTLDEIRKESSYPNVVDEMIASVKFRYSGRENDKELKQKLYDEVKEYYLSVLDNAELSEVWRFEVYDQLRSYFSNLRREDAINKKMMNLVVKYMQEPHGHFYPAYRVSHNFIDEYIKLEHTDEWKEKSNKYLEGIFKVWTSMMNSNHTYGSSDTFMLKLLQLHFETNGTEKPNMVDSIVKMARGGLWKNRETYAILINYDQSERARKSLLSNKHKWNTQFSNIIEMSPEFEAKAEAFISSFENPEDALYAKLATWLRSDDRNRKKLKLQKSERIEKLAKDYLELVKSKDSQAANAVPDIILQSLLSYRNIYPILRDRIFELSKDKDFLASMTIDNNNLQNYYFELSKAYFTLSAEEGNAKPLVDTIGKIDAYCTSNSRYRYEITRWVRDWLRESKGKFDRDKTVTDEYTSVIYDIHKAAFDAMLKIDRNYRGNLGPYDIGRDYALISMVNGKMDEFLKAVNGLDKNDRRDFERSVDLYDLMRNVCGNSNNRDKIKPERLCKSLSEIRDSEFYEKELKKNGIGEIKSIYAYLNERVRCNNKYLIQCLEGDRKYLTPADEAYLQFHAGNIVKSIAACDVGIEQAETDTQKASLIISKASYCQKSDPNEFRRCCEQIEPFMNKLDKRLHKSFQNVFPEEMSKKVSGMKLSGKNSAEKVESDTISNEKELVEYLNNDKIPVKKRIAVYKEVADKVKINDRETTIHAIMDAHLKYMQPAPHMYSLMHDTTGYFIGDYMKLKRTEKWKEKGRQFLKLYYQKYKNSQYNHLYGKLACNLFYLQIEANGKDNPENVDRLIEMTGKRVWSFSDSYLLLAYYGQYDRASKALMENKAELTGYNVIKMTPEILPVTKAFIDSFDNPIDALFAKLVMWKRTDDRSEEKYEKLTLRRRERLQQLNKDYLKATANPDGSFQANDNLKNLVIHLINRTYTDPVLDERIIKLAKGQDLLEQISKHYGGRLRWYYHYLGQAYFTICFKEGNAKPMLDTIANLGKYLEPGDDHFSSAADCIHGWIQPLYDRFVSSEKLSEQQLTAIYQICHAAITEIAEQEKCRHYGNLPYYYGTLSMAAGKMDVFVKTVNEFNQQEKKRIESDIRLKILLKNISEKGLLNKISPVTFSKGVSEISGSKLYAEELNKSGIGRATGIYEYLKEDLSYDTNYLLKCLEKSSEHIKPVDVAFLCFLQKEPAKAIAACNEGIKEANTDTEKILLILKKAEYSKTADTDSFFDECWQEIQPFKDKIEDKKLLECYKKIFDEQIKEYNAQEKAKEAENSAKTAA